ncbi:MAG: hypothetical protein HKL96_00620 [Phycisphaerales bacterium]|nr:hypothetical protein [Phycisphaerales bacterium]
MNILTRSKLKEHLKLLPLTVLLTVLLWMYADANLTAVESDLPIHIRLAAGPATGPHAQSVQLISPADGEFEITVQGPRNKVSRVRQQCEGRAVFTQQDRDNLSYVLTGSQLQAVRNGHPLEAIRVLNRLPYFRQSGVLVTAVRPKRISCRIDPIVQINRPIQFQAVHGVAASITPAVATVSLPKSLLDSLGGSDQISIIAQPLVDVTQLPPRTHQTISAQLTAQFAGSPDKHVVVTPATAKVSFTVPPQPQSRLFIGVVPVWVSGPPWLLNQYQISVRSNTLRITVSGAKESLQALRDNLIAGDAVPAAKRVIGFLDIPPPVVLTQGWQTHRIRYALPKGITLLDGPHHVLYKITSRSTSPATAATAPAPPAKAQPATTVNSQ